jgi:hypothetical protein
MDSYAEADFEVVSPVPIPADSPAADSKPIQIWEGVVLSVDSDKPIMYARLTAKMGDIPDHTAAISFEWIHDQDRELVKSGAVFYLTLFRKRSRGSVQNSQEIRFRRVPNWSSADVHRLQGAADVLLSKIARSHAPGDD